MRQPGLFLHRQSVHIGAQPDGAAKVIMKGIRKNKARILIGPDAHVVDWIRRLFPASYLRLLPMMDLIRNQD